jgi:bifunctional N-acetylglucosamine-1-phosphate-uridyltransferase/glucosamine-1-phosphate-acetyltransferase GlmU-like protein
VPADALALARGRQVNKEGWAARLRRVVGAGRKPP